MFGWMFLASVAAALAGYMALATIAAQRLLRPRRRTPRATPAEIGLAYQEVRFRARGEALQIAAWHIPAAESTRAIIIAHGVGGCRGQEFTVGSLDLVKQLVKSGFGVLMLDLRGHGASDAAPMTYGIRERHDVLGAVDWLLARGYAHGAIGVLGASMGGVAAMGAAGEEPAIGALISDSACADFQAMLKIHFQRRSRLPNWCLPSVLLAARLVTGENLARLRPAELLRRINHRPVLIIHAGGDRLVPPNHANALARAGDAELWLTKSSRHLGSLGAEQLTYSQRVIQFFDASLAGRTIALPTDAASLPSSPQHRLHRRRQMAQHSLHPDWETLPTVVDRDETASAELADVRAHTDKRKI